MDEQHARQLLAEERRRIEQAMAARAARDERSAGVQEEPGERGSEDLYEKEFQVGIEGDLSEQLAALERAEARIAAGTYGLSVQSGQPIPDGRLEALPLAERTVEEQQARDR